MSDSSQQSSEPIDQFVKDYLDGEAARIDATDLVARIQQTCLGQSSTASAATPAPRANASEKTSRRLPRWIAWTTLTAAAVVVAFLGGRYFGPDEARASHVLRDVQAVHSSSIDRCYQVQYAPDPRHWNKKKKLEGPSHSVLWTRGDRFWSDCTIGDIRLVIGREQDGTLWISSSPKKGSRFTNDASQLPAVVSLICDINSMSIPQLIEDVLADFDLRVERPARHGNGNRTLVWASLQPDRTHPLLSDAMLEIDAERNLLVRLVLWTVRDGRPKGTVTYTLLESSRQSDEKYRLQSHLDADADIEIQTLNPNTNDSK